MRHLARPAEVPRELWRGYAGRWRDFHEYDEAAKTSIVFPAFSSASSDLDATLDFATSRKCLEGGILLKLVLPQLALPVVCSVEAYSDYREEAEHICLPGCAFRVSRVSKVRPDRVEISQFVKEEMVDAVVQRKLRGIVELALLENESAWVLPYGVKEAVDDLDAE